jgi:NADH:ubiquinone oxidoreductase subunit 5 (subunit L)/multisubunit Na+/H+ antiporter MnhA subunit
LGSFSGALTLLILGTPEGGMSAPTIPWVEIGTWKAGFGILGDPLARMMAVVVSGVAFFVHIY